MADKSLGFNVTALDKASKTFVKLGETVERLERKLNELDRTKADPKVTVDTRRAERDIGTFAAKMHSRLDRAIRSLPDVKLGIDANTDAATRRILRIKRELESLRDKRIGVDIDATAAQNRIEALSRELVRLGAQSPDVQVRADTAAASAALATVSRQASSLDRQDVNISVGVQGIARAISMMGLLTAGMAAAGAAAPAVAAGIAAIPAAAGAAVQGVGALATGFSGVGDAVKELEKVESEAAKTSVKAGEDRAAAAERVASAQRGLAQAQIAADRAAITGAQRVADARRNVEDAERAAADAVEQAADDVVAARERLVDAGTAVVRAEADLHEARQQAIRDLQDLSEQVSDNALTIEGAEISLQRAQERQSKVNAAATSSALDRREATHRVAQAQDRLSDAHREAGRDQEALNEAERRGVEGSRTVLAARFRLYDAEQRHRAALADMREAQAAQARTQQESARKVADAQRSLARAQQQAAWAQQDASARVTEAQAQVAAAMAKTATAAAGSTAAQDRLAEAMAKLSPAGRDFARFLHGEMLPALRGIRGAVQETLLPRMQRSMSNLLALAPLVSEGLAETGRVIGDLSVKGSEMMTSGPWQADFATIMAGNNRILADFGLAGLDVADAFRHITVEALPMVERFSQFTQRVSEQFAAWIEGKRATGELGDWFAEMGDRLAQLGAVLRDVAVGVWDLSQAMAPMGMVILETLGNLVEKIGDLAQAHPTLAQLAGAAVIAYSAFITLGKVIAGLGAARLLAITGWTQLADTMRGLAPTALNTRLMTTMGLIDASGVATQRAATRTGRFAGAVARVGANLPALAAALGAVWLVYDSVVVSAKEAADAINAGGKEAEKARERIRVLELGTQGWLSFLRPLITTQEEATAAAKAQYDALGPLAQAQQDVKHAQEDYDLVLRDFPPTSDEAKAAAERLGLAQRLLEDQQDATAAATKSHTEELIDQQNQMLGMADSDLAFRQSVLRVEEAQRRAAEAVAEYGARSHEGRGATLGLEQAMLSSVAAAGENARAQYENRDSVDANAAAVKAQNGRILELITQAGTNAPPALLAMAGKMDGAALSAHGARRRTDEFGHAVLVLPNGKEVPIAAPGAVQAKNEVEALTRAINDLRALGTTHATIIADIIENRQRPSNTGNAPGLVGRAAGGPVFGAGTTTSDSILGLLSDNEHVWTAREVRGAGGHDRVQRLRELAAEGALPAFAAGGPVRVRMGSVSDDVWQRLLGMGYRGDPTDRMEALYIPRDVLASVQAYEQQLDSLGSTARATITGGLGPLVEATVDSGFTIRDTWARNTDSVDAAQRQQSSLFAVLAGALGSSTVGMAGHIGTLQSASNTSWADMRARTGTEVGTITGQHFNLLSAGLQFAQNRTAQTRDASNAAWANIRAMTRSEVGQVTGPIFGGLHAGLGTVQRGARSTADIWTGQMGRLRAAAANPIRWIMQFPLGPPGIAASWNTLNDQFKLNKRINPPVPGFATGGEIRGQGSGTSDSILARLSDGEYVIREQIASRTKHFLDALNAGQPEAIQAAGGANARMPGFAAGGVIATQQWAEANDDKRYRWGGVGPGGYDCSGWLSAITNMLRGENPHRRLGTTATFPWPGFRPGLRGAWSVGSVRGTPGHMAGTLGGINAEAGGRHNTNAFGPPAIGADHPQFRTRGFLPQVGGRFVSGGGGGGAAFDPGPIVNAAFKEAYRLVGDVTRFFGASPFVVGGQSIARQAVDAVKARAMERVAAVGGGGLGPVGAGAPFYVGEISRAAKVRGLGVDAATIGTATSLVETGLRNLANPRVPASLRFPHDGLGYDHDSIGLFQQRSSGWGTVAQRMNPFASAGMFFDKLRSFDWRSMPPGDAAQRVQVSAFPGKYATRMGQARGLVGQHGNFDKGGLLHGKGWYHKDTIRPERMLDPSTTQAFERLVNVLDTRRMPQQVSVAPSVDQLVGAVQGRSDGSGQGSPFRDLIVTTTPQATADQIIGAAMHRVRVAKFAGSRRP